VNEKERRYWQDMVDEYCCRDGQCERCAAILAADAIVRAAREFTAARLAAIVAANCDEYQRWQAAERKANQTMEALCAAVGADET
jgi:hypothetical protein